MTPAVRWLRWMVGLFLWLELMLGLWLVAGPKVVGWMMLVGVVLTLFGWKSELEARANGERGSRTLDHYFDDMPASHGAAGLTYVEARAKRERARAAIAELELEARRPQPSPTAPPSQKRSRRRK